MKLFICILSMFILIPVFGQEMPIKIVEVKGQVDIKDANSETWRNVQTGEIIAPGFTVATGLRAQITMETGGIHITVNQNSVLRFDNLRLRQNEAIAELTLERGYMMTYAKTVGSFVSKVLLTFTEGSISFEESGGEIFTRRPQGVVFNNIIGTTLVSGRMLDNAFISRDESCIITYEGKIVGSDVLNLLSASAKPSYIDNVLLEDIYFGNPTPNYSQEFEWNDFTNNFRP